MSTALHEIIKVNFLLEQEKIYRICILDCRPPHRAERFSHSSHLAPKYFSGNSLAWQPRTPIFGAPWAKKGHIVAPQLRRKPSAIISPRWLWGHFQRNKGLDLFGVLSISIQYLHYQREKKKLGLLGKTVYVMGTWDAVLTLQWIDEASSSKSATHCDPGECWRLAAGGKGRRVTFRNCLDVSISGKWLSMAEDHI